MMKKASALVACPDDARHELSERVVKHLEGSGFELDERGQALRQRPPRRPHSTPD